MRREHSWREGAAEVPEQGQPAQGDGNAQSYVDATFKEGGVHSSTSVHLETVHPSALYSSACSSGMKSARFPDL